MTFAGLAYKMGDIKRAAVKDRVAPLTPKFDCGAGGHKQIATAGVDAGYCTMNMSRPSNCIAMHR